MNSEKLARTSSTVWTWRDSLSALPRLVVSRSERLAVGLAMGLFASVTIATSLHLAWAHSHMRPNVELTDGLQARISEQSIVSRLVDYRIAAANGQTVSDLQQLDAVIGAGSRRHLLARVVPVGPGAGQRKRAFWWERREAPRFELDGAGVILGVDPALPDGKLSMTLRHQGRSN